jgi:hypothetical protein
VVESIIFKIDARFNLKNLSFVEKLEIMAVETKKEYWTDIIRKNPSSYEGKFIIHDETEIFFVHEDMMEAVNFSKNSADEHIRGRGVFLVPYHFNSVRLRGATLKIGKIPDFIQFS